MSDIVPAEDEIIEIERQPPRPAEMARAASQAQPRPAEMARAASQAQPRPAPQPGPRTKLLTHSIEEFTEFQRRAIHAFKTFVDDRELAKSLELNVSHQSNIFDRFNEHAPMRGALLRLTSTNKAAPRDFVGPMNSFMETMRSNGDKELIVLEVVLSSNLITTLRVTTTAFFDSFLNDHWSTLDAGQLNTPDWVCDAILRQHREQHCYDLKFPRERLRVNSAGNANQPGHQFHLVLYAFACSIRGYYMMACVPGQPLRLSYSSDDDIPLCPEGRGAPKGRGDGAAGAKAKASRKRRPSAAANGAVLGAGSVREILGNPNRLRQAFLNNPALILHYLLNLRLVTKPPRSRQPQTPGEVRAMVQAWALERRLEELSDEKNVTMSLTVEMKAMTARLTELLPDQDAGPAEAARSTARVYLQQQVWLSLPLDSLLTNCRLLDKALGADLRSLEECAAVASKPAISADELKELAVALISGETPPPSRHSAPYPDGLHVLMHHAWGMVMVFGPHRVQRALELLPAYLRLKSHRDTCVFATPEVMSLYAELKETCLDKLAGYFLSDACPLVGSCGIRPVEKLDMVHWHITRAALA